MWKNNPGSKHKKSWSPGDSKLGFNKKETPAKRGAVRKWDSKAS